MSTSKLQNSHEYILDNHICSQVGNDSYDACCVAVQAATGLAMLLGKVSVRPSAASWCSATLGTLYMGVAADVAWLQFLTDAHFAQ